jgi:hypothetical protein
MNKQKLVVIKVILVAFAMVLLVASSRLATAQTTTAPAQSDEQVLRDLVRQENEGKKMIKFTEDCIVVHGAYARPLIGRAAHEEAQLRLGRSNRSIEDQIVRLVVSQSTDMAEEFGNFTMSYDEPNKKHVSFNGSYLRVWRKINGEWLVDAFFARPNEPEEKKNQKSGF